MDDLPQPYRINLKDWEAWLASQVRQIELLGEIPITADECEQLGKVIGLRVRTLGHNRAMRTLRREYPCAFAVYLVAQGVYGYRGGDYWSEVVQVTGLKRARAWQVGQVFEEILEELGLPLFYDLRAERAQRYVSLILAHGGVPNYCLPDFFKNMLQPSVLRVQYADMSPAELIDEWQWRSSVQYFTDKPVIRFLAYGGHVAEDFADRCREMAWEYLDSGMVPNAAEVGLPERVVDAYRQWIAEQSADQVQREVADRWRLRKPEVLVDPWGEGVILDLPPQQVPATMIEADIAWQVTAGEESYSVPVRVRRTGFDWKTAPESVSLSQPAATYEISLLADGQVKRTWRYRGVNDERPLLVFDPERGTLLSWQHSLPARCLGLIYPGQFDLEVEGEAKVLEELPRLPWGWAGFCGQMWDLSHATRLTLLRNGETVLTAALRPDESTQRPHLVGGQLLTPEKPSVRAPVYTGPPPCVRIPLRLRSGQALTGRRDVDEELARWRLTVRNKWSALPKVHATTTLADLRSRLIVTETHVDLPLSQPSLLGEAPCGNFLVRLRGPLGRDAEFTLRIVPHLVICSHETLHLPDAQSGPQPATLLVETSPGDTLECQGEGGECHVRAIAQRADAWEYEIEAGPDVTEAEVTVVRPLPSGDAVRVPVSVPIRRLRWALVGGQAGPALREWSGRIIERPVEALLQTEAPCLLVDLPAGEAEAARMVLHLLDIDSAELQRLDTAPPRPGQQRWRFDLSAFRDTVRNSRSPVLRFELECRDLPGQDKAISWPVLSLSRAFITENVEVQSQLIGNRLSLVLSWHEPMPLRHRHVRFWPLWQPWLSHYEHSIPDEARGELAFEVQTNILPLGKYRLEFIVVDPWVSAGVPYRPQKGTPGTADVTLISPVEQLCHIDEAIHREGKRFGLLLERAIIRQETGDREGANADRQWCYEHINDGTIRQILALVETLREDSDSAMLEKLQLEMSAPHQIARMLEAYSTGELSPEGLHAYLHNLSEARTQLSQMVEMFEKVLLDRIPREKATSAYPFFMALLKGIGPVRVGTWVRSDAGWGCIERIENVATKKDDEELDWRNEYSYRLYVTLRPHVDAESIVIDLPAACITFSKGGPIFTCICHAFSTRHKLLMIDHFRVAHGTTKYVIFDALEKGVSLPLRQQLEFSATAPRDELA